ncbi:MAG: hypothetical protein ACYDAL_17115 [Candidatus Dormibacteraceae bacterium]
MNTLVVTTFGALAVTFMMVMYALERRHPRFVLAFAVGCLLSSAYGFMSGAWPFGVVEGVWAVVAARRYLGVRRGHRSINGPSPAPPSDRPTLPHGLH